MTTSRKKKNSRALKNKMPPKLTGELIARNENNGRIFKRLASGIDLSKCLIPDTLIQFNTQNNTVYYTDINLIIIELAKSSYHEKTGSLAAEYKLVMDMLHDYHTYFTHLDDLFKECRKTGNQFDAQLKIIIEKLTDEIKKNTNDYQLYSLNNELIDDLENVSNAYLKILLTHLYSAFNLYKSAIKDENVILNRLISFKACIQDLLEILLTPDAWQSGLDLKSSVYASFIFNSGFNIEYIGELIKYDRRFEKKSLLQLIKEMSLKILRFEDYGYSDKNINGRIIKYDIDGKRIKFVVKLVSLLEDIDKLIALRNELGAIDNDEIFDEVIENLKKDLSNDQDTKQLPSN